MARNQGDEQNTRWCAWCSVHGAWCSVHAHGWLRAHVLSTFRHTNDCRQDWGVPRTQCLLLPASAIAARPGWQERPCSIKEQRTKA
eukprot:1158203-Pelagomonas_calceolata.AAC.5